MFPHTDTAPELPLILGIDVGSSSTRAVLYDAARTLRDQFDEAEIWQRTGCPLRTSYLPALFTWLAQTQQHMVSSVQRWMRVGEWWFEHFFDHSNITSSAASWTGLLNRNSLTWDHDRMAQLPIRLEQFGDVVDVSEQSGEAEATCRGIVLLALQSLGVIPNLEARPAALRVVAEPNARRWEQHQAAIEQQAQLYDRLCSSDITCECEFH